MQATKPATVQRFQAKESQTGFVAYKRQLNMANCDLVGEILY